MNVYKELRQRGAAIATVGFSGGNDEGFIDSIVLTDAAGKEVERLDEGQDDLAEALAQPVWDRYGGFAGDFYVTGSVTWTVANESMSMDGRPESGSRYNDEGYGGGFYDDES